MEAAAAGEVGGGRSPSSRSSPWVADRRRWGVLAVFAAASGMGALVWNLLVHSPRRGEAAKLRALTRRGAQAPVYAVAELRFDKGPQAINSLANAYYIWYCPGSIFALWVMERYGLRVSLLAGFASQVAMISLSVYGCTRPDPHAAYWTVWVGQLVGSFGQPLFLNNVTRLAGDWFPMNERDMAVTVSVVARSLGVMVISAVAPYVVTQPDQVALLYNWQLPVWLLIFALAVWLCRDRPATPPSAAAAASWAAHDSARAQPLPPGTSRNWRALQEIWAHAKALAGLPNFIWLALSFSLLTGIGWTFLTIVGQLLEPCGYRNVVAGAANAVFMGANAVGCLAAAPVVEHTRAYLALQRLFSWLTAAAVLAVLAMARAGEMGLVLASWAALGFAMGPLTPVSFEHAVEMTFPIPAQSSNAILNLVSNLVGFLQTVGITPLLADGVSATCSSVYTPAAAFTVACTLVGLAVAQLIRRDYRRMAAEGTVAGDPWEYGSESGFDAKIKPDALPGALPAVDARTPLLQQ